MDGYVEDEYSAVQLAKLLGSCFVLRGGQLAVIQRLDAQHIVQIQINLLNWIVRRIAACQKNKKNLRKSLLFFRVMEPLLSSIQNRDALKMCVVILFFFFPKSISFNKREKLWSDLFWAILILILNLLIFI